jgi:hypothetical protein
VTLTTTRYSFGLPGVGFNSTTTNNLPANTTFYNWFKVTGKSINVKHIAFEVTTAPASTSNMRIAIYAASANTQPTGAPLYDSGAVSVSSAAAAIYRIRVTPFTLPAGNYVILMNMSVGFTVRVMLAANQFIQNTLGSNLLSRTSRAETLSGAYPNPGNPWNTRGLVNNGTYNTIVLGW